MNTDHDHLMGCCHHSISSILIVHCPPISPSIPLVEDSSFSPHDLFDHNPYHHIHFRFTHYPPFSPSIPPDWSKIHFFLHRHDHNPHHQIHVKFTNFLPFPPSIPLVKGTCLSPQLELLACQGGLNHYNHH